MPRGILHGFSETLAALHESHAEGDSGAPHRILQTSSARRASELTAFWAGHELKGDDITPANRGWQGQYPEEDNPDYDDDSITIEFPKPRTTPSPQWLGIVEDPETLASTDIGDEEWIGHPQPTRKHLKPGEFPQCEPFLTGKYSPWWHPSFEMKMPVHAVRVRLTDLNNHVPPSKRKPIWDVIFATARYAEACSEVREALGQLRHMEDGAVLVQRREWQDSGGAFSAMHYQHRQLTDGWHLDHGLVASLIRLWQPPPGGSPNHDTDSQCHTSIVDFGAGGGRYCDFFNKTGEYCCFAYDGTSNVVELSKGLVQTQRLDQYFDLGRTFDWVMCLEVAEHIPEEAEDILLDNLKRHAKYGLILSWSEHGEGPHQNAKPWQEVKAMVEAKGFSLDTVASSRLRPQISWMRGSVHVFRVV
mmetsp:Transcript_125791/g.199380  ORF Transcript_125791/g.199380 Transcript_125791/m.199380 type:complete len:417 (+) Transcript_125791:74-1324(+)